MTVKFFFFLFIFSLLCFLFLLSSKMYIASSVFISFIYLFFVTHTPTFFLACFLCVFIFFRFQKSHHFFKLGLYCLEGRRLGLEAMGNYSTHTVQLFYFTRFSYI